MSYCLPTLYCLQPQVPFHAVLGNHDYGECWTAQDCADISAKCEGQQDCYLSPLHQVTRILCAHADAKASQSTMHNGSEILSTMHNGSEILSPAQIWDLSSFLDRQTSSAVLWPNSAARFKLSLNTSAHRKTSLWTVN